MMEDKYIGKRLDGRYELTALVGAGGMANVYSATDVLDGNKRVAVKVLKPEYSENEEFLHRFRNESKAIAVLSHPNIVKIFDMGFSDKIQYIVMEYIDGITLKDYIDSERVLNWKDAVHFVVQILRALQHAHNRGIVHRDIKPQNIMLLTDGTIKVMDFGIAKFAREESRTATAQAIGTVHYISPEQARGDETDARSDIYSVGVMFYEMLTGQKPFDTDNLVSIAVMHMQNVPQRPRDINPNIPSGLEEIIMHAMEKDSKKRYQNANDMIRDIEAFKADNRIIFGYFNAPDDNAGTQYFTPPQDVHRQQRQQQMQNGYDSEYDQNGYTMVDESEPERQKSLAVPILTAVTIVVVIVAAIVICMILGQNTGRDGGTTVEVPSVIGMDYDEAVVNYPNVVFDVAEQEYTDKYEANIIYKQSVDGGQFVKKDSDGKIQLAIAVSRGIQKVDVPDLNNYEAAEAKEVLQDLGLTVVEKKTQSTVEEDIEAGRVIRTDPKAGEKIVVGAEITIYVSQGVAVDEVDIIEFVGMDIDRAKEECEKRHLEVETEEKPSDEEKGTVIEQDPEPGTTVEAGSTVKLTVSSGEEPEGEITYGIVNLPKSTMSGMYTLNFTGEEGVIASRQFVAETLDDNSVSVKVTGKGKQTVKVSITSAQSGQTAVVGTYVFDFANGNFTVTDEDISAALNAIAVVTAPVPTQAPTEAPTEAPAQPATEAPAAPAEDE